MPTSHGAGGDDVAASAGDQRFVAGVPDHPNQDAVRRAEVASGQRPFAVLFGCSDSRLAVIDRGPGDLFVVRTAGHAAGAEVLGQRRVRVVAYG